jgi:hypothetical protein
LSQRHQEPEDQKEQAQCKRDMRPDQKMHRSRAAYSEPTAEHEDQLPNERIKVPHAFRIGGQVLIKMPGDEIKQQRSDHHAVPISKHEP